MDAYERLLRAWVGAELFVITERSTDITESWRSLVAETKRWCYDLGIDFQRDMIPEHVWEWIGEWDV